MSNRKKKSTGENNAQSETENLPDVKQEPSPSTPSEELPKIDAEKPIDLGTVIVENTDPPSESDHDFSNENSDSENNDQQNKYPDFDPSIHCSMPDGSPRFKKDGSFRMRKKKRGNTVAQVEMNENPYEKFVRAPRAETLAFIGMITDCLTLIMAKTVGDEWNLTEKEKTQLTVVWARFCEYKGWADLASPEMVVIGTTFMILLPRLTHPNFKMKFASLLGRKVKNAHANTGTDKKRQDDSSSSDNGSILKSRNEGVDSGPLI